MIKKRNSIRVRFALWFTVFIGFILLIAGFALYHTFKNALIKNIDSILYAVTQELGQTLEEGNPDRWQKAIDNEEEEFFLTPLFIQILKVPSASGDPYQIHLKSKNLASSKMPISPDLFGRTVSGRGRSYLTMTDKNITRFPLRLTVASLFPEEHPRYIIQIATSLEDILSAAKKLLIILIVASPLILLFSSVGGYILLTKVWRPIQDVVSSAKKITAADLSHRIEMKGRKDEVGDLIATFNGMISRLEKSIGQIRQFTSDVSHDLKTPLTAIRGQIEVILRKERDGLEYENTLKTILEETDAMERIIENLLLLSRMESHNLEMSSTKMALDEVVLNIFEKMGLRAKSKNIVLNIINLDTAAILGDEILIGRMITNLLDNAVKYTPPRGRIDVSVQKRKGRVVLEVRDTGIGIPENSLSHIFDRFYRVDESRSRETGGAGLGLAIVKWIADWHGAKIHVHSKINEGSVFSVDFAVLD